MCYAQMIGEQLRKARKQHVCAWCGERIEPKTKFWHWFGKVDGDTQHSSHHEECRAAEKRSYDEGFEGCWYHHEQTRGESIDETARRQEAERATDDAQYDAQERLAGEPG